MSLNVITEKTGISDGCVIFKCPFSTALQSIKDLLLLLKYISEKRTQMTCLAYYLYTPSQSVAYVHSLS